MEVELRDIDQAAWSKDSAYLIDEEVIILDLIREILRIAGSTKIEYVHPKR